MSNDVMEKVKSLPQDKQQEVEDFINYLLSKYTASKAALHENKSANFDWAKGKIWIANDFNDTPSEFKDYL